MKKRKKWSEMTREEKDQVKAIWKKRILVGMAIVAIVASIAAMFSGCAHKTPNINNDPSVPVVNTDPTPGGSGTNPIVNPNDNGNGNGNDVVNPDDNGNGNGNDVVNPDDNGNGNGNDVVNPDDNGNGNGNDVVNPDDNGNGNGEENGNGNGNGNENGNGEENGNGNENGNGEENGNGNGEENGNGNGSENGDGGNGDGGNGNGDNPGIDNPIVTNLDFSGLETKLEEIAAQVQRGATLNKLMSYSVSEGKLYFAADITRAGNQRIIIYSTDGDYNVESQENIDSIANSITKSDFAEVVTLQKASADIELNGVTYSKDGFAGDNVFARQCGIEDALMTYVSDMSGQSFSDFGTGYARTVKVLVISNSEENGITVTECSFGVESDYGITNEQLYQNLITEGKNVLDYKNTYNLGKNLMPDEATSSATTEYLATLTNAMVQSGEWYM